jgi:hypothetical protein
LIDENKNVCRLELNDIEEYNFFINDIQGKTYLTGQAKNVNYYIQDSNLGIDAYINGDANYTERRVYVDGDKEPQIFFSRVNFHILDQNDLDITEDYLNGNYSD